MLLRVAETDVPDPSAPNGWRRIPAFRSHGAIRSLIVLDALWWYAYDQETGTPRTGTSTLAWLMAPLCGWEKLPAPAMIDRHAGTIRLARRRLVDAGLVLPEIAQDEQLQDRATDWLLLPAAEDLTDEELAAADTVIAGYRRRHPDADAARARSAARLAERWRAFLTSIGRNPSPGRTQEKTQSPPLPSGFGSIPRSNSVRSISPHRARDARDPVLTRPNDLPALPTAPRTHPHGASHTEDGEASLRRPSRQLLSPGLSDLSIGRQIAAEALFALPEHRRHLQGLSVRRARRLAVLARRGADRIGLTPGDIARALATIVLEHGIELHQAVHELQRQLDEPAYQPPHVRERLAAAADRKAARRTEQLDRRARHIAGRLPHWIRLDPLTGLPLVWTRPGDATAPAWIACHHIPDTELLDDSEIRAAIHAAAALARITGPQRLARAIETGQLERIHQHHADPASWRSALLGNGQVHLIGLDNTRATVPPPHSTAPAHRWTNPEPRPTPEQLDTYRWLAQSRARAGLTTPPAPATAREISAAISAMQPTDNRQ